MEALVYRIHCGSYSPSPDTLFELGFSWSRHWNRVWDALCVLGINIYKRKREEAGSGPGTTWTVMQAWLIVSMMGSSGARAVCQCLRPGTVVQSFVPPLPSVPGCRMLQKGHGHLWGYSVAEAESDRAEHWSLSADQSHSWAASLLRRGSRQGISMAAILHSPPASGLHSQACSFQPALSTSAEFDNPGNTLDFGNVSKALSILEIICRCSPRHP